MSTPELHPAPESAAVAGALGGMPFASTEGQQVVVTSLAVRPRCWDQLVDEPDRDAFELHMHRAPQDRWVVSRYQGGRARYVLSRTGEWVHRAEEDPSEWMLDYADAVTVALATVDQVRVNGVSASDLARA